MARRVKKTKDDNHEGMKEIFCRYIRKNGKIIYPKNRKFFHFWVKDKAA